MCVTRPRHTSPLFPSTKRAGPYPRLRLSSKPRTNGAGTAKQNPGARCGLRSGTRKTAAPRTTCPAPEEETVIDRSALIKMFFPASSWWPQVNKGSLRADLAAGLTGAIIVLPQGVAFAMIAGLPPEYGLYTAIVPAIIAALFGSSSHLVSGPTTAISIVLFTTVSPLAQAGSETYIEMVITITFLAGMFQLSLGVARRGALVNFVSHSVVVGFTSGAALLIATSQLSNFLGV